VVEYTAHTEAHDTMAGSAVDRWDGMSDRWSNRRDAMAGIATEVGDNGGGMVGEGAQKTGRRMTANAIGTGNRMRTRRDVGWSRRLAYGRNAIVTTRTATRYTRVIKLAIHAKLEKTGGIVTVVALGAGR